jgi:membrane associated rhomboid family serine protease
VHVVTNPDSTLPTLGASGAIAGVMGAYFLLFPHSRVVVLLPVLFLPLFFELPAVTYLAFWALSQVFSGTLSSSAPGGMGGIAWWAHVGGFAAGVILQFFFVKRGRDYRPLAHDEYGLEAAWVPIPRCPSTSCCTRRVVWYWPRSRSPAPSTSTRER